MEMSDSNRLFPAALPQSQWTQFSAAGYEQPVTGIVTRSTSQPTCGMPIGSVDTGCVDIQANGTFGLSSIFNSIVPRRGPLNMPLLGIATCQQAFVLTTLNLDKLVINQFAPNRRPDWERTLTATDIDYWGHYPILDMEYEISAPVSVGMRAFAPFIPGDVATSNTPGAVFDVYLRNNSEKVQEGRLGFSFPGPTAYEAGLPDTFERVTHTGDFQGVTVKGRDEISYTLGVVSDEPAKIGGCFGVDIASWTALGVGLEDFNRWHVLHDILPPAPTDPGSSLAVRFSLKPGEVKKIRFILAWYSPTWLGGGSPTAEGRRYEHMYASRYEGSEHVARMLYENADDILKRIIAWQQVIYSEKSLPDWLRDSLINILHLITEDGLWAQAKPPVGQWCKPEDGIFGMIEDPRNCPQIECIPCSLLGNLPLVYFFPELALSTMRAEKAYQFDNGQPTWVFGGPTANWNIPPWDWIGKGHSGVEPTEFTSPSRGYQTTMNGACLTDMADRIIMRSGDEKLLHEFYPMVKKAAIFTMNLRPEYGPRQIISMPTNNAGTSWMEGADWFGMAAHIGGVHLAQILIARRMAQKAGDGAFVEQCDEWLRLGREILENEMWTGTHYLLYNEPETNKKSDVVYSAVFDGEWIIHQHGIDDHIFREDRTQQMLKLIRETADTPYGMMIYADPAGGPPPPHKLNASYMTPTGIHAPSTLIIAMTYMYKGHVEYGLDLARRIMHAMCCKSRCTWDAWIFIAGDTGNLIYGNDYYQNMVLWSLPTAMEGKDLAAATASGGLVDRMIKAGNPRAARPVLQH
jgi:uncharacterized protein (DUF608 family)